MVIYTSLFCEVSKTRGELLLLSLCCSFQTQDFKNLFTACLQRTTPGDSSGAGCSSLSSRTPIFLVICPFHQHAPSTTRHCSRNPGEGAESTAPATQGAYGLAGTVDFHEKMKTVMVGGLQSGRCLWYPRPRSNTVRGVGGQVRVPAQKPSRASPPQSIGKPPEGLPQGAL